MRIKNILIRMRNAYLVKFRKYKMATIDETIDELISTNKSIVRFGDGELTIVIGGNISFQPTSCALAEKLKEVLDTDNEGLMLAVPGGLGGDYALMTPKAANWWKKHIYMSRHEWDKVLNNKRQYYNALISRFYVGIEKRSDSERIINKIKQIWRGKRILIVEGCQTKMGVGNDLLNDAKEVKRILCPAENAFRVYDEIVKTTLEKAKDFDLVLASLGPVAKPLTLELFRKGIRCIDIGHLDNEYEWFLNGQHKRTQIPGKYVNEIAGGNVVEVNVNNISNEQILHVIM